MKTMTNKEWAVWYVETAINMIAKKDLKASERNKWVTALKTYLPQVTIEVKGV